MTEVESLVVELGVVEYQASGSYHEDFGGIQ